MVARLAVRPVRPVHRRRRRGAPAIIAGVAVLKVMNPPRRWRELVVTLGVAGVVLSAGVLAASSPPLQACQPLKATSIGGFFSAFLRNLAWPLIDHPLAGVFVVTDCRICGARGDPWANDQHLQRFVIGLAAWVLVQAAAIAYGRGGGVLLAGRTLPDVLSQGLSRIRSSSFRARDRWLLDGWERSATVMVIGWSALPWRARHRGDRQHQDPRALAAHLGGAGAQRAAIRAQRRRLGAEVTQPPLDLPYPVADSLIDALRRGSFAAFCRHRYRRFASTATRDQRRSLHAGAFPTTPNDPMRRGWGSFTARTTRHWASSRVSASRRASVGAA